MSDAPQGPTVFNDRYELHRKIARGGMADVYLAKDLLLDRPVAVKVLFPEYARDESFVERFRREAKAAANLNHPNIVAVYDWGEEHGTYFIVMEYLEGRPLSDIIHTDGPAPPVRAAEITSDVAAGLAFAHAHGVIHRDVKPGNIIITTSGQVKVTDFGIAQAVVSDATQASLTQVGAVMGTATYFAPEQAQGRPVDPRSDLYSLGCVLYELLTGKPPFSGDTALTIAYRHVQEKPAPPREVLASVPAALDAIDMRLLAKDPDDRYASADELRGDLKRYLEGRPLAAAPVVAGAAVAAGAATTAMPLAAAAPVPPTGGQVSGSGGGYDGVDTARRRRRAWAVVIIALLVLLAGVLLVLAMRMDGGPARVGVPNVENMVEADAIALLESRGFEVETVREPNNDREAGRVVDQDPGPGTTVDEGSRVTIFVSAGLGEAEVPRVEGLSQAAAERLLEQSGFIPDVRTEANADVAEGVVISQDPGPGTMYGRGQTVTVIVSSGPETIRVPNVAGDSEADATSELQAAELRVTGRRTEPSEGIPSGSVIGTDPAAGTLVPTGSGVTLVLSSGPAPTTTTEQTTTTTAPATTTTAPPTTTTTEPVDDDDD